MPFYHDPHSRERHQLLRDLPELVREQLPPELRDFQVRQRGVLCQLFYGDPAIHFEAWFHLRTNRFELGLHFEKSPRANEGLFQAFDQRIIEIKGELGETVELERWEKGWARVYETLPGDNLDERFRTRVVSRLARLITVLQPMVEEAIAERPLS